MYHHRHEEYVLVIRDDLQEIKTFGWLQQVLFGTGVFFFSGAFWLLMELLAHQEMEEKGKFEFTAWMAMCVLSMGFGATLSLVALILFWLRQRRLTKYFPATAPSRSIASFAPDR